LQTSFSIEETGRLGCAPYLGNCLPTFRRDVPPLSSGLWLITLKSKVHT